MAFKIHFLIYITAGSGTASNTQAAQSPARWQQYLLMQTLLKFCKIALLISLAQSCTNASENHGSSKDTISNLIEQSSHNIQELTDDVSISNKMIDTTDNSRLEDLIVENVYVNFKANESSTTEDYRREYEKFSMEQRIVYATIMIERNVEEIGLEGYFGAYQSVGQFADYALKGYNEFRLTPLAEITSQAMETYKNKPKKMKEILQQLTTVFKSQLRQHSPSEIRVNYIRQNKEKFITK